MPATKTRSSAASSASSAARTASIVRNTGASSDDDGGTASAAYGDDHVFHGRCRGSDVVTVDCDVVDAVAGGPSLEWRRMLRRCRRELGVAVVLAEEDRRQLPYGGQVERFVERAL